jgi:hypothetical protein
MKTYLHDFCGCTGSITDKKDGTAQLIVRLPNRKKIHDKIHKSRKLAQAAWNRMG